MAHIVMVCVGRGTEPSGIVLKVSVGVKTLSGPKPNEGGASLTGLFQKKLTKVVAQCKGESENRHVTYVISVQISDLKRISSRPKHNVSTMWVLCVCVCAFSFDLKKNIGKQFFNIERKTRAGH